MRGSIQIFLLAVTCLFLVSNASWGDTGVFFGAGNQVMPIKNSNIHFVRETVDIKLTVDKDSGRFGVPFIPWANVTAKFYFKNTTTNEVSLQMGFPFMDLQGFGDEKYVLDNLNFEVVMDGHENQTQLKEGVIEKNFDPKGLFKKVFTWPASFKPSENKEVIVTYRMLLGVASVNSIMRSFDGEGKKFMSLDKSIPALVYDFAYVTKTAYTWAGPIEHAVFHFDGSAFYETLRKQNFVKGMSKENLGYTRPIYWESVHPQTDKDGNGIYNWDFKNHLPEDGLAIQFFVLFLPSIPSELDSYFKVKLPQLDNVTPEEFKDVLAAYYQKIAYDKEPVTPFLQNYFKDIPMLKMPKTFIFESDKTEIHKIANDFDKLIKN